jgi:tetratricopeptide (TPR) repeat protein
MFKFLPVLVLLCIPAWSQTAQSGARPVADSNTSAENALHLADTGHCPQALPVLKRVFPRVTDKDLKRLAGLTGIRCAMTTNQSDEALDFIRILQKEYPKDPDVLYTAVHVFSDLSVRASQDLLFRAPASYQVHQLNAEALEAQGKWNEAALEYRSVLERNPKLRGIHFRIGRLILSQPKNDSTFDNARKEFEAELQNNPNDVAAEYVLGEIARQSEQWPDAIQHFKRAAQLDPNFADAYIGLGRSFTAGGQPTNAIQPLQAAVRLQPENPTPHYHLAIAFNRAGRKPDAEKEFAVYQQTSARAGQMKKEIEAGILGPQGVDPNERP